MKRITYFILILFSGNGIYSQININPDPNGAPWIVGGIPIITTEIQHEIDSIPEFHLNQSCISMPLIDFVDNSERQYMREIFNQKYNSCSQAASVGYMFTYEINLRRNIPSQHDSAIYHPAFTYNFLNYGIADSGSFIQDGLRILKEMGCPSIRTYGKSIQGVDSVEWMSGHNKYDSSFINRISNYEKIDLLSDSALIFLKYWLYNHNSADTVGGLSVFAVKHMQGCNRVIIEDGPESGKSLIISCSVTSIKDEHVLTIVGYNDSIQYDIDNDSILEANEVGAFKVANSWGYQWPYRPPYFPDSGYCYILYSLFDDTSIFLNGQYAYICNAIADYEPEVTIYAKMTHPNRKYFGNQIGSDTIAGNNYPSYRNSLWAIGNGKAGTCKLTGGNSTNDTLEIAIDFSYFLDSVPDRNLGKIFSRPFTKDSTYDQGILWYGSIIDHRWGKTFELPLSNTPDSMKYQEHWDFSVDYDLLPFVITADTTVITDQIYRLSDTIKSGAILQLGNNQSKMELHMYDAEVIIEEGGTLHLSDSNSIIAKSGDNRIIVQGNLIIEPGATIKSEDKATLVIEFANDTLVWEVNGCDFENVEIMGYCASNVIDSCTISNCNIELSSGEIIISANDIDNSFINLNTPQFQEASCEITGNSVYNDFSAIGSTVITIDEYPDFLIENNNIQYYNHRGIELFYSGYDGQAQSAIRNNTIDNIRNTPDSTSVGIHSYLSFVNLEMNVIKDNAFGIAGFHEGKTRVEGDSSASTAEETQQIYNNFLSQAIFSPSSIDEYFRWNVIGDSNSRNNPFVKVVEYEEINNDSSHMDNISLPDTFDVMYNCWIYENDPTSRLVPVGDSLWFWNPVWCPGQHKSYSMTPEEIQYEEGLSLAAEGEYMEAQATFKYLAEVYPSSNFATLSLKELFRLKSNFEDPGYEDLKAYYDSLSATPADSLLGQTADWLSIHCDVSAGNYQDAVSQLDSILFNPGSFTDSIFALIDLGNVLTKMEDDSLKSFLISMHKNIMPETYKEFKIKRKDWIDELLRSSKVRKPQETIPITAESEDKPGHITSIFPNPANELLTINYLIKVPGKVRFTISSVAGQKMFSSQKTHNSSGEYTVSFDIFDFKKGIYILAFYLNETLLETRKVVR